MAVAKLSKLFIASHKDEESVFLKALQKYGTIDINPYKRKNGAVSRAAETESRIGKIKQAIDILSKQKGFLKIVSDSGKIITTKKEYEETTKSFGFEKACESIISKDNELNDINTRIQENSSKINLMNVWRYYKGNFEDLGDKGKYTAVLGKIEIKRTGLDELKHQMKKIIDFQILHIEDNIVNVVIIYHNDNKAKAGELLNKISFEEAETEEFKGTVNENKTFLFEHGEMLKEKKNKIINELKLLVGRYEKPLTIMLDHFENELQIENALLNSYSTKKVSFFTGWIKTKDFAKFQKHIQSFNNSKAIEMEIDENESIPIMLENKKIFKPFEIVTKLYGVPRYHNLDPTPLLSLFFALFFGLCLTDAGYGIVLVIIALILAKKMKNAKYFMYLMFISGIFTVFAGAVFNGWFGDLPSYLGIDRFFTKIALLGDPIKTDSGSMNFFRLALLLGVIQVFYGLFIKFFDSLRKSEYKIAILDTLTWIILVGSLVILLLSSDMAVNMQLVNNTLFPPVIGKILFPFIMLSAIIIVLFGARNEKNWGFRIFMGFLNLTILNGITSFLGDFLSYIRLMALGLVTAGIGVAINKIAFQTLSVPYIGILFLFIILIFGHTFNLAINILGAFVHTLRLQYVEFFQKFYEGGGKPFKMIKEKHKYIIIQDES